MVGLRWPDGKVKCPECGSDHVTYLPKPKVWKCYGKHAKAKFSLKTGTLFEDSPLGLDKWLPVMWMVVNCKNGISSWEIHRAMGVTQKTAWFMLQRCRLAMQDDLTGGMLGGEVEVDESFIGGKARNMHKSDKRRKNLKGGGPAGKEIVLGILEREGKVRATVIPDRSKAVMQEQVRGNVEHMEAYVKGNVHTNTLENFWSLLKRSIGGTYVSVEPFHLFRYIDEQAWRYNNRKMDDGERFTIAMAQIVGRRLTYQELTGKPEERPRQETVN